MQYSDIDAKVSVNPVTHDISVKTDAAAIKQHVEFLVMGDTYCSILRPGVCAGLRNVLFEPNDTILRENVTARIRNCLLNEPRVEIVAINVTTETNTVNLDLQLKIKLTDTVFTYTTKLRRVT